MQLLETNVRVDQERAEALPASEVIDLVVLHGLGRDAGISASDEVAVCAGIYSLCYCCFGEQIK